MSKETLKIAANGQWTLEKSLSKTSLIAAAALAGMLSRSPTQLNNQQVTYAPQKVDAQEQVSLHPDLHHIAFIESSSGKNKNHKTVNYGLNRGDKAAGLTGLMPYTVKEIVGKNKDLKSKYGSLLDKEHHEITSYINSNENVDKELANTHWNRLSRLFPKDELRRVYAWKNGVTGAFQASGDQVKNHPYVKKYVEVKYQDRSPSNISE
jgi:succinate dehydrogenase flavin-adding protein (antitoxin of CptAB toxin-antitoxin module)